MRQGPDRDTGGAEGSADERGLAVVHSNASVRRAVNRCSRSCLCTLLTGSDRGSPHFLELRLLLSTQGIWPRPSCRQLVPNSHTRLKPSAAPSVSRILSWKPFRASVDSTLAAPPIPTLPSVSLSQQRTRALITVASSPSFCTAPSIKLQQSSALAAAKELSLAQVRSLGESLFHISGEWI